MYEGLLTIYEWQILEYRLRSFNLSTCNCAWMVRYVFSFWIMVIFSTARTQAHLVRRKKYMREQMTYLERNWIIDEIYESYYNISSRVVGHSYKNLLCVLHNSLDLFIIMIIFYITHIIGRSRYTHVHKLIRFCFVVATILSVFDSHHASIYYTN